MKNDLFLEKIFGKETITLMFGEKLWAVAAREMEVWYERSLTNHSSASLSHSYQEKRKKKKQIGEKDESAEIW